jgi:FkbM family methyltransferase
MVYHKLMNNKIIISLFITFFLLYFVIITNSKPRNILRLPLFKEDNTVDLSSPLEPEEEYKDIDCVQTIDLNSIVVTICLYQTQDIVSQKLRENRIYEEKNLSNFNIQFWLFCLFRYKIITFFKGLFTKYLIDNPNYMVIDIGTNIGLYTLFSSKLGRDVLSVEPFQDNILRLHKAIKLEGLDSKVTLLKNVVFNERNIIKRIHSPPFNSGNKQIDRNFSIKTNEFDANDKYMVSSILLDDLVDNIPINKFTNKKYEKAIMKIDIEGFEAYAFQSARRLLNSLDIRVIFMEWMHVKKIDELSSEYRFVSEMVELLVSYDYNPFDLDNRLLDPKLFSKWNTHDVIWSKINFNL